MLILIFKLSKFPTITFYLCENLSLNTQGNQASKSSISSKEHPSLEKIFQTFITFQWSPSSSVAFFR
jgi:hypothetical protein